MTTEREQQERKAYLENEKLLRKAAEDRRLSTYLAMALADSELPGRFGKVTQQNIVGIAPTPQYPAQPSIPWPNEPDPLGFSVEDMPVVGEPHEIEEAARILREREDAAAHPQVAAGSGAVVSASAVSSLVTDVPAAPLTQSKSSDVVGVGRPATERAVPEAADAARSSFRRRL
jgi:hypothetical protein